MAGQIRMTGSPGPSVDHHGNDVVDPTRNVLDLVLAAVKRLDDLSSASERRRHDLQALNDRLMEQRDRRQDDLRVLTSHHNKELSDIRADYEQKLRIAESQRIDAIRTVDVAAVQRAAEVSTGTASTLAAQVQTSADALRSQVVSAATQAAASLTQALAPIQESIAELRRLQYEQQGQKAAQYETRGANQWTIGIIIAVVVSLVQIGLHFLK